MIPNKENILKWVEALESGEYKQGIGSLRVGDNYCCLGVACEVAILNGVKMDHLVTSSALHTYDGEYTTLPRSMRMWLGIDIAQVPVDFNNDELQLSSSWCTELNDCYGKNFVEIAQCIRQTYLTEE